MAMLVKADAFHGDADESPDRCAVWIQQPGAGLFVQNALWSVRSENRKSTGTISTPHWPNAPPRTRRATPADFSPPDEDPVSLGKSAAFEPRGDRQRFARRALH